ncbi:bifunctional [glutamate--ammonia ligase]-adenylyl-L-tyrosine phosphorylase/[glutamate--ammonia-ligase] adenylyltransferase [Ursidibacter maritimus]|uniref:Bifunctional glutamine synthetase adenylyltransferase/adenylyl-removing enzyme n=1 Tax=Ursidibacter maritimus TaxID=1331689 RepID=A0A949T489_9PAST|nr:bifunctional [glutamate--ammonia ligase]-adenylyl-L-tyrosine phosphorylase/[glutamate--ammonia-ligase] adenylyltransferase [Ursidibacter maritimus]MBV6523829.1 bifunctional [glutamate--ammonia ligase]-adenylyl-L-tyrosine phosphorylase/[glutamate--ammonia-ligase] adenylyltransferase [Ursidibacter maritimus]MBV6526104.1 bifunctional [glutamate--ammonia ligase]-adenylyl-L-tyrosine phosphorylase/[glutamate--ammonia-ligase] adenylyltransferase [Ursidibacter maritimus]MBV6527144.1 bifunctional [glu
MSNDLFQTAQQQLSQLCENQGITLDLQNNPQISPLITAIAMSDFVATQLQKQPELLVQWLVKSPSIADCDHYSQRLQAVLSGVENEEQLHSALRRFRHREMATLSFVQSNRLATVQQIFERLSDLAEALILGARDWLFERLCQEYGTPMNELGEKQELLILGMGKLGGRELNFSSDIDLIFTYPDMGETVGARKPIENSKFFTRLGQRLIRALDEVTAEGFVYRTDMRLRPFGDSGALVLSFSAMEDYYQEQGRDWERYAMIKAKILGEDLNNINHKYLKQLLRPFVYRRYLDFSAIQSLREMKQKISREVLRRGLVDNIKLGAGGIREVEFIVQTFQMMRGGRDKILQQRSLLQVLPHFVPLNLLSQQQVEQLQQAYLFLRNVENTLQAINDQQTQTLPTDPIDQARIAFVCQCDSWQIFLNQLQQHQQNVRAVFNELIGEDEQENDQAENTLLATWRDILHYQITEEDLASQLKDYPVEPRDYPIIFQQLSTTFQDWVKRSIGVRGREVLRKLMPKVADQLFNQPNYLVLLPRILNILDKINTRTTYLELLLEKEQILPQLMQLCGQSIMISEQIARYPMLLDELILAKSLVTMIELDHYPMALQEYLMRVPEDDEEALIDALRQFKQSHILRIAAADILGVLPVMKISDHLTYLAEAIIGAVVNIAWRQVAQRFGTPEHLTFDEHSGEQQQDFVVIGYGKLGGIELGYNSDLDLVFLHNAPEQSETQGGKKSISSHQFYLKLAQKINGIFNLNTSAGVLYEVDMRLRPSGEAGLLVSTFKAFQDYQQNEAWTWESQALVRARAVYGSKNLRAKFTQVRREILSIPRESGELRAEICKMRAKMYEHLSHTAQGKFHLKTDQGGITDIEFIAQYLVLNYAHHYPTMTDWSDNVRIFERSVECGILTDTQGETLKHCYITLRNQIHHLNLLNQDPVVASDEFVAERQQVQAIWRELLQNG